MFSEGIGCHLSVRTVDGILGYQISGKAADRIQARLLAVKTSHTQIYGGRA